MSTWHQPGQSTLHFHGGHCQPGKTGHGMTLSAAATCVQHPLSAGGKRNSEHGHGAQPLSRRIQGMLAAYFPPTWLYQYQYQYQLEVHVPMLCKRSFHVAVIKSKEICYSNTVFFALEQPFWRETKLQSMALSRHFLPLILIIIYKNLEAPFFTLFFNAFFLDLFQMTIYLPYHRVFYSIHHCSIYTFPC